MKYLSQTDCMRNNYNLGMQMESMQNLSLIFERGGIVMVPLIMLSVISVALIIDRFWFWYFGGGRTSLFQSGSR